MEDLPLAGLQVIDASSILAAPMTSTLLGEFGAEVVKVEPPDVGDAARSFPPAGELHFKVTNRNKSSVTIDLREPEGAELLLKLCDTADVAVVNVRPSTARRWGMDPTLMCERNPRLVALHLTAFGREGPYAERPGFARIAEAFAGLTHITGEADGPPLFPGYPIGDGIAGIYGAFLVMVALENRARTGSGQLIDLGLYEPVLRMMEDMIVGYDATGESKSRHGNDQDHSCPNGLFGTADGTHVVLPASTNRMWERLVPFLDLSEVVDPDALGTREGRVAQRELVDAAVERFTQGRDRDELLDLLDDAGVAAGVVNTAADICDDPHISAHGDLIRVPDPQSGETLLMQAPVGRFSTFSTRVDAAGPALGADTQRVLSERLGLSEPELADLAERDII